MDNTTLPSATGGDVIRTDDVGAAKIPVSKLATGESGRDGGMVGLTNPLFVEDRRSLRLLERAVVAIEEGNELLRRLLASVGTP